MNQIQRARSVAGLLLVLVAAAGFAGGMVTERHVLGAAEASASAVEDAGEAMRILIRGRDSLPGDGERRVRFLLPGRLSEELGLTPQQQVQIEGILAEDQAAIRQVTEGVEPALMAIVERSRQRIHEVLTDEQRARWHAMPGMRLRRDTSPQSPQTLQSPRPQP